MLLLGMFGYILQVENLFCFSCLVFLLLTCQDLYFATSINFALIYFSRELYKQNEDQYNEQYNTLFSLETHKNTGWWPKWSMSLFKEILKIRSFQTILFHGVLGSKFRDLGNTMLCKKAKNMSRLNNLLRCNWHIINHIFKINNIVSFGMCVLSMKPLLQSR